MAKAKFRVRFHLAKGPHFMQWQVTDLVSGSVNYHNPESVLITLYGCKLRNQPATARKIHAGADKTVCAWIDCESLQVNQTEPETVTRIKDKLSADQEGWVSYNPKVAPHWQGPAGGNFDNATFSGLLLADRKVFVL